MSIRCLYVPFFSKAVVHDCTFATVPRCSTIWKRVGNWRPICLDQAYRKYQERQVTVCGGVASNEYMPHWPRGNGYL
jgi:hypothetical protein